jgi:intracellular sulfur oxidation DsrE/DsrF family protein
MIHSTPGYRHFVMAALLAVGILALVPGQSTVAQAVDAASGPRVVYHMDDSARAIPAIRNMTNHLKADPEVRILVVALAQGVDFLLKDAKDEHGNPYEPMIDDLILAGVEFRVCNNTLTARQIDRARVHPDARVVESGAAEITRLQFSQGYAYFKP